ncbi:hypothetical protein [Sphingomonas sp.]|uniref:hypothetical protein n=1 Tax=Sphingomonas sp. TaxID=28214 RepID=UPI003CC582FB
MTIDTEPKEPEDGPGTASAEQGLVVLDGPDGVAVTMDADAARETGERLIAAAEQAAGQGASPAANDV